MRGRTAAAAGAAEEGGMSRARALFFVGAVRTLHPAHKESARPPRRRRTFPVRVPLPRRRGSRTLRAAARWGRWPRDLSGLARAWLCAQLGAPSEARAALEELVEMDDDALLRLEPRQAPHRLV